MTIPRTLKDPYEVKKLKKVDLIPLMINRGTAIRDLEGEIGPLRDQVAELQERIEGLIGECAELHGYINRVEIEDDAAWHKQHGAGFGIIDGKMTDRPVAIPVLRMRLRGVRYVEKEQADIFHKHFDRAPRHGG